MKEKNENYESRASLVWSFLEGSRVYFVLAIFFACALNIFRMVEPKLIGYTVDTLIDTKPSSLNGILAFIVEQMGGDAYLSAHLGLVAFLVIGVALLAALSRYLFQVFNAKGAETLVKTMRDRLFHKILHLPFAWHSVNHTGDIIQRCTSDVEQIKVFLSEQLTQLFRMVVLIVMAYSCMFSIHVGLAFVSLAFVPITLGYSLYFHRKIGSGFEKVDIEEGKLSSVAQENLTGVRVVRAFGKEVYEKERFEKQNAFYTDMWIHLMRMMSFFWMSSDLVSYLQILAVLCYGAVLTVQGVLTPGAYIEFLSYNAMLTWPVRGLGRVISNMSKAGISVDRLRYIMNANVEMDEKDACMPPMDRDIVFDHVSFRYEGAQADTLKDVCLTVPAGKTIGILGGTGSGKSTLMYLLDRMYDLESGSITIGDVDIRQIQADWLRSHIGMVLQEPYLFSRTLGENICIARRNASLQDLREASRIASLDEAVAHFKKGYETFVGERGVTLSGGQKQRAAIAQMLIKKPEIMVFDDSLSAVDAETDAKIRNALSSQTKGSTVILIAHRITTLMNADHIYVLDQGRVVEHGSHEELIAENGIYRRIFDLQVNQGLEGEEE